MAAARTVLFGDLLRRYRVAAGLTQEELAERAGLSAKGISDLERGARTNPRRDTVSLLVEALGLAEHDRNVLAAAARQRTSSSVALHAASLRGGSPQAELPLVGRASECAMLERHLSGNGGTFLVFAGEPGVGKSRLLREAAERAAQHGWAVLAGGCHRRSGQEPFAPFTDILAHSLAQQSRADRRARLEGCGWLAHLLPEFADLSAGAAQHAVTLSPEQERRLMFAAVVRYLANVGGPAGAVLVLDDLQWAGLDALDLLAYIARAESSCAFRVIAAYRDTEVRSHSPLGVLLADLAREGLAERALLSPLPHDDAERLLDELLPQADNHLRQGLLQRTGGLPFFLVSCAQGLASGALSVSGQGDIPWSVAETIRQRISALPESAQTILHLAAIVGRDVRRSLLLQVAARAPLSEAEALPALEAACSARLLYEEGTTAYAFAHDLVREVIAYDISTVRRALLHRQIAETLEQEPHAPPELLAHHYSRSDNQEKAIAYLEKAGDQARARFAHAEAAGYYRELVERFEALGQRREAARVREQLASVLAMLGRYEDAQAALEPATRAYQAERDIEGHLRAVAQEAFLYARRGLPAEGRVLLDSVLPSAERLPPSPALSSLYAALSWLCYADKSYADQLRASERGVSIAQAVGDEGTLLDAEVEWSAALWMTGRLDEAERVIVERVLPVAENQGNVGIQVRALNNLAMVYTTRGEYTQERHVLERTLALAERMGDDSRLTLAILHLADNAFVSGNWRAAHEQYERGQVLMRHADPWMWSSQPPAALGVLAVFEGDIDAADRYREEVRRHGERGEEPLYWLEGALAERDLLAGRFSEAAARLIGLLEEPHRSNTSFYELHALLGCILVSAGDLARGTALADETITHARAEGMRAALADALRYQAWIAITCNQPDAAERALDESLALARPMPRPYSEAKSLYVYGLLHLHRGERDQVRACFRAAMAICQRLGEHLYAGQIEQALATLEP
jgi:tetratricopeptide (TPR) repeat protein/transcriptional regulator with XRE-family HTH domain